MISNRKSNLFHLAVFLPNTDDLFLYFTPSKVTADFIVDTLEQWWEEVKSDFPQVKTLVIHLDNGPENNSHRTQFIKRIVVFAQKYQLRVRLAYYPPYHSKYNPIERCWGVLENHWNGNLLDTIAKLCSYDDMERQTADGQTNDKDIPNRCEAG